MADYEPTDWVDNETLVDAARLEKIEAGVDTAHDEIEQRVPLTQKGAVNGVATLGADGKVPTAQLPPLQTELAYEGDHVPATTYQDGDVVVKDGIAYICVGGPTTEPPAIEPWGSGGEGGGGADLTYEGDFAAATEYQDGDVVVKDGIAYLCVGGPTQTAPDPAPWGAGRPTKESELAYAEKTSDTSITATTQPGAITVVTAPPITFDGQTAILIEFFTRGVSPPAAASAWTAITLWEDGVAIDDLGFVQNNAGTGAVSIPVRLARRLTPSAGVHTYSIRAYGSQTGALVRGAAGSPAFIRISVPSSPIPIIPGASLPVSYGTTLPVNPVDGQEAILVDNLTNPSYQWRFRYNAGSSSPYKWECVGSTPLQQGPVSGGVISTGGVWTDVPGTPVFTVPRSGSYEVIWQAKVENQAYTGVYATYLRVLGSSSGAGTSVTGTSPTAQYAGSRVSATELRALVAGETLKVQGQIAAAVATSYGETVLSLRPVRVS